MAKKIGLVGYYEQKNFGDDLLAVLFYKKLAETTGKEVIVCDCSDELQKSLGFTTSKTWKKNIHECSYVIFGGGGVLGELKRSRLSWRIFLDYFKKVRELRKKRIPHSFIAVGAGPIRSPISKMLVKYIVRSADMVVLRDEESYNELLGIGIKKGKLYVGIDYALSLKHDDIPIESSKYIDTFLKDLPKPVLGVNLCNFNCHNGVLCIDDIEKHIQQLVLQAYKNRKIRSIVIIVSMENMPELLGAIKMLDGVSCSNAKVYLHKNVWDTCSLISKIDFLFTMKLHLSIVSYILKTPVFCVGYHPKIERFYRQINKMECYENLVSFNKSSKLFDKFFDDAPIYFDQQEDIERMINDKLSEINFNLLKIAESSR